MPSLATTTHTTPAVAVDTQKLIAASVAPNTAKAYRPALSRLSDALGGQPPTDATLADYLAQGHGAGLSPASLAIVVQAVRFVEKLEGRPSVVGPLTTRTRSVVCAGGVASGKSALPTTGQGSQSRPRPSRLALKGPAGTPYGSAPPKTSPKRGPAQRN